MTKYDLSRQGLLSLVWSQHSRVNTVTRCQSHKRIDARMAGNYPPHTTIDRSSKVVDNLFQEIPVHDLISLQEPQRKAAAEH